MSRLVGQRRHVRRLDAPGEAHGPLDAQRGREPPQGLLLAAIPRHGKRRVRVSAHDQRDGLDRIGHVVARLEVARRQEARPERYAIPVAKGPRVHHVRNHPRDVAAAGEDAAEIPRRNDDRVGHLQKRMDEAAPAREMVVGLAAVVVEDHALAEPPRRQDRRHRAEQERPVRGGEDVHDVALGEAPQARSVERLGQHGPRVRAAPHPAEAARKRGVDGHDADRVPFVAADAWPASPPEPRGRRRYRGSPRPSRFAAARARANDRRAATSRREGSCRRWATRGHPLDHAAPASAPERSRRSAATGCLSRKRRHQSSMDISVQSWRSRSSCPRSGCATMRRI